MEFSDHEAFHPRCCPCGCHTEPVAGIDRRVFLGGAALGGLALGGMTWSAISAAEPQLPAAPPRRALVVKPAFFYRTYTPRPQSSWRSWGGIETQQDADGEVARINEELKKLQAEADFPMKVLPLAAVHNVKELEQAADLPSADVLLVYAANGDLKGLDLLGKQVVFFIRHQSGPLYLWYEIISPRYLRQHKDQNAIPSVDPADVVVDRLDEVVWRLRALCGLANTVGSKILAIGGPGAWAQPKDVVPNLVREKWKMDLQTVGYDELGKLLQEALKDPAAVALAERRATEYLKLPGTKMEAQRGFLDRAFLLEMVFRKLMTQAQCRAITVNACMGTIMKVSETTACMPLSTLNDEGWLAFCESDFVVIPSGMLAANISGRPMFLNDPTYPHDGLITLAHCTAPRKLDGKQLEPVRILTHFESDYGAAPKVEMRAGQKVTNIIPDFASQRWVGFLGEIVSAPFLPICRSQIEVRFTCDAQKLAERMPGFHWMMVYGDCMREMGYALKKIPIEWEVLG